MYKSVGLALLLLLVLRSAHELPLAGASTSATSVTFHVNNVITRWNTVAQQAVRSQGIPNQIAARFFSFLHISQYKALQQAYQDDLKHPEAAAAYAAHYVLSELFPWQQSPVFDGALEAEIEPLKLSPREDATIRATGTRFAARLLSDRTNDGSQQWSNIKVAAGGPHTAGTASVRRNRLGEYQLTSNGTFLAFPQLKDVRPLVSKLVRQYDVFGGPPRVPSARYDADYATVARVGDAGAPTHTREMSETAWFWEDAAGTAQLASHLFNVTVAAVAGTQQHRPDRDMSIKRTARLFAALAVANYEAHIAAWYLKYKYRFWRPVTAFRQGSPGHPPRPGFSSAIVAPPEPEYPSGHASSAGALAAVLSEFFRKPPGSEAPAGPFVVASESPRGLPTRTYRTIDGPSREIVSSRVYGGIHFPTSVQVGYELGFAVGKYDWDNFERVYGVL